MEPDGGMPGKDMERRTGATVAALFAFMSHGNTVSAGPFRSHVQRLVAFLKREESTLAAVFACIRSGQAPKGDWVKIALGKQNPWPEILKALGQSV